MVKGLLYLLYRDEQDGFLEIDRTEIVEGSSRGTYTVLNTNKIVYLGNV